MEAMKIFRILLLSVGLFLAPHLSAQWHAMDELPNGREMPFKVSRDQLAICDGRDYVPVFLKGINLGVSIPGTQPGQLAASAEDYQRWFRLIKEAGYNAVRVYTMHFPRFYEEIKHYNETFPQNPLYVIHGVWLEEQDPASDLYSLTSTFDQEIRDVVRAVHGDITIDTRAGKAYGDYTTDISPWIMGFLIGREIFPSEVSLTNEAHAGDTIFSGSYYSLPGGADPVEQWIIRRVDSLVSFEHDTYNTVRPVGIATWPTLDPIYHPTEQLLPNSSEDKEQIDLSNVEWSDSSAGFFIGYHAYPYYPDFITSDPLYAVESDPLGPNNYLGYLKDLKNHYRDIPLVIAEFGVPSSWGSGHLSPTGMNHGGLTEHQQGEFTVRMLDNILQSGCAGAIQFSLIDEWFKQTWITNPYSSKIYRQFWHNITSPEENFGILAFAPPPGDYVKVGEYTGMPVKTVKTCADYDFFRVRTYFNIEDFPMDTLWIAFDTYSKDLGESLLPNGMGIGTALDTLRAEFVLMIPLGSSQAELFVIPSYDVFGVKEPVRLDTVVSRAVDDGEWNIVRWKTNYFYNVTQYIGKLAVSTSADPYQFLNAVTVFKDSLEIRIPWTLINFYAPNKRRVLHYQTYFEDNIIKFISVDSLSDGIALTLSLAGDLYQTSRFTWDDWEYDRIMNHPPIERKKQSFHFLKENLYAFNNTPIGRADSFFIMEGYVLDVDRDSGLLVNDFDMDGNELHANLAFGSGTSNGQLYMHPDGSFQYIPDQDFAGKDYFMYYLDDDEDYSTLIPVNIFVDPDVGVEYAFSGGDGFIVYPNPGKGEFSVRSQLHMSGVLLNILDISGRLISQHYLDGYLSEVKLENVPPGIYLFKFISGNDTETHRIIVE
jgi:hypothetical protein